MQKIPFGRAKPAYLPPPAHGIDHDGFRRRFDSGRLTFGFGTKGIDCIVLEISPDEAHVRVHVEPGNVPKNVFLVHYRTWLAYEAVVTDVGDDTLMLEFIAAHDLKDPATPELEAMSQACAGH